LICFIIDRPMDIKFIKLNLLLHFRGSVSFDVQAYEVQSHSRFGPFRGSVQFELRSFSRFGHSSSVTFELRSFEVRSYSRFSHLRFGHSRFGLSTFSLSRFGLSRFGHGFCS
jgi:hypothetical protein